MASLNSTANEFGFLTHREHTVFGDTVRLVRIIATFILALLNASIAIAFLVQKVRRHIRVSPSGLLVLNLVFADALLGATVTTVLASRIAAVPHHCGIWTGVLFFATTGPHFALINVVLDRFIAIAYTLQYRGWMSMTRCRVMVFCGWCVPFAGLVYGSVSNNWNPGPARRCPDIRSVGMFLKYAWVPVHAITALCIIVIQFCVYLHLRRYDAGRVTSNKVRSFSHKSARILFWIVTPTYAAMLSYDIIVVIIVVRQFNLVLKSICTVLLLFVDLSFLLNPVVYSFATANIKKPVSDLCKDVIVWLCPSKRARPCDPQKGSVWSIERESATASTSHMSLSDCS